MMMSTEFMPHSPELNQRLPTLLVCDDDALVHQGLARAFGKEFDLRSVYSPEEAIASLKSVRPDLIIVDWTLREEGDGLKLLKKIREIDEHLPVLVFTGQGDLSHAIQALQSGAVDFLLKGMPIDELGHILRRSLSHHRTLETAKTQAKSWREASVRKLVGKSPTIQNLRKTIERLSQTSAHILITGETGTGKEVVARSLRRSLPDGSLEPFVAIDSSTIQGSLAESVLFGHEKGAFTGASELKRGVFEEANGGTVYFDEIGNMPLEIQNKLLRVIQEKEVRRLGSSRTIPLSFRIISATNQNLETLATEGRFKTDLLQRLQVIPIQISPLRERREDIPVLADFFLKKLSPSPRYLSTEALAALESYHWPGNIRELENVLAYGVALTDAERLELSDLPPKITGALMRPGILSSDLPTPFFKGTFYEQVAQYEKQLLEAYLKQNPKNLSALAQELGMDRSHLYTKLAQYGLKEMRGKSK